MRALGAGLGLLALLVVAGCSDRDPVSSTGDDGSEPAGKLVVSGARAGGYLGRLCQKWLVSQKMANLFNEHDVEGWLSYLTEDASHYYVAAPPPMSGKEENWAFMNVVFQAFPDASSRS